MKNLQIIQDVNGEIVMTFAQGRIPPIKERPALIGNPKVIILESKKSLDNLMEQLPKAITACAPPRANSYAHGSPCIEFTDTENKIRYSLPIQFYRI